MKALGKQTCSEHSKFVIYYVFVGAIVNYNLRHLHEFYVLR